MADVTWVDGLTLVAPLATGAIAGWLASRWNLWQAREDRGQARIEEAYRAAARYTLGVRQYANVARAGIEKESALLAPPIDDEQQWMTHTLVELHGSPQVRRLYEELVSAQARLTSAVDTFTDVVQRLKANQYTDPNERTAAHDGFVQRRNETDAACDALIQQMRVDLKTG